jgi:hypothetical protein
VRLALAGSILGFLYVELTFWRYAFWRQADEQTFASRLPVNAAPQTAQVCCIDA